MATDLPPDIIELASAARESFSQLDALVQTLRGAAVSQAPPLLDDDVAVLRAKYETVHRYVDSVDSAVTWLRVQAESAFRYSPSGDVSELEREMVHVLKNGTQTPCPSVKSIRKELDASASVLGAPYQKALKASGDLFHGAFRWMGRTDPEREGDQRARAVAVAMGSSFRYLEVSAQPARYLKELLAGQLRSATAASPVGVSATATELPEKDQLYQFLRSGDHWAVRYGHEQGQVKDSKGMQHIAALLSAPNNAVAARQLTATGGSPTRREGRFAVQGELGEEGSFPTGESLQPTLDQQGIKALKQHLEECKTQIEDARRDKALAKVKDLEETRDQIEQRLRVDLGLGGKSRKLGSPPVNELATAAVRKAIIRACQHLKKLQPPMEELAVHIENSIRWKGTTCAYCPSPPVDWKLGKK
jgi:hypothetical protein